MAQDDAKEVTPDEVLLLLLCPPSTGGYSAVCRLDYICVYEINTLWHTSDTVHVCVVFLVVCCTDNICTDTVVHTY